MDIESKYPQSYTLYDCGYLLSLSIDAGDRPRALHYSVSSVNSVDSESVSLRAPCRRRPSAVAIAIPASCRPPLC